MNSFDRSGARRRWLPRSGHLWVLAAALGALTILAAGSTIHDSGQRRATANLIARMAAEQLTARVASRLEVLSLATFAPVMWPSPGTLVEGAAVDALARAQREGERCRCRETMPASVFFRLGLASDSLDVALATVGGAHSAPPPADVLRRLARGVGRSDRSTRPPIRLHADTALGERVAVSVPQYDEGGDVVGVYGLVAPARPMLRALFARDMQTVGGPDSVVVLARFDSLSLEVSGPGATPLFGQLAPDRSFRATVRPGGALEGLVVSVALARGQIPHPLPVHLQRSQLWQVGALLACTILVLLVAVGSARREISLARARSDFIAGVSHDLRMPLAQVLIASETLMLQRERDEGQRLGLASSIVREARRLITLVDNVLLFSRSGAIDHRPRLGGVAVGELFDDVVEAVQLAVDDAGQSIEREDFPPFAVLGDRSLLRQALVNLIDNALKYGREGQRIRIGAERASPSHVRLWVEDDGPGVPAAERARVFEPYERLTRDRGSERTGTGLGLAMVRHIARLCDGRVWLEAARGGGTRVLLELRVADVVARIPEPAPRTPEVV